MREDLQHLGGGFPLSVLAKVSRRLKIEVVGAVLVAPGEENEEYHIGGGLQLKKDLNIRCALCDIEVQRRQERDGLFSGEPILLSSKHKKKLVTLPHQEIPLQNLSTLVSNVGEWKGQKVSVMLNPKLLLR